MTEHKLRDSLARDRTMLANERTLLAYARTSIMLAFSGVTALKIFPDQGFFVVMGIVLIPIALAVGMLGYWRFRKVRQHVSRKTHR
jgi:putative membrane protein